MLMRWVCLREMADGVGWAPLGSANVSNTECVDALVMCSS